MTARSRRYFSRKKFQRFVFKALAKSIQEEIDKQIMEELIKIANAEG